MGRIGPEVAGSGDVVSADEGFEGAAPRDFATLRGLLAARAQVLPRRLKQVALYALDYPDEVAFGTAASVAAQAEVQPSTLVRFSQALGYQGFSDLQEVFRARLRDRVPSYDERLSQMKAHGLAGSRAAILLEGFADAAVRSIEDMRHKLDPAALDNAVGVLAEADTIYLAGLRRSFPIAFYMAYAMGKLGLRTVLVDGLAGLGPEQTSGATPRDAMLAISFTPYASETVALAGAARRQGAKVVAITDSMFSPIAAGADAWLEVVEANFEGFRSMAAMTALATTLAVAVAARRDETGPGD